MSTTPAMDAALERLAAGEPVLVENRASSGFPALVVAAAEHVTAGLLVRLGGLGLGEGYLALPAARARELGLRPASTPTERRAGDKPQLMQAIDARACAGVGLSAADRARTVQIAAASGATARDFTQPGHVVPVIAEPDGTLRRPRATEAAVDLARLADAAPAAMLWPVLTDDGEIPDLAGVARFAAASGMARVSIDEIVAERWRAERPIERIAGASMPTRWGAFVAIGYRERISGDQHLALVSGTVRGASGVVASMHEECVLGAALRSTRCGCRARLDAALRVTAERGGVVIYSQPIRADDSAEPFASCSTYGRDASAHPTRLLAAEYILAERGASSVRWLDAHGELAPYAER